ncbi:MAG: LCP family protein [Atopobiaceae bacterium]|nr:LCP family protein [Atopobiaceae bacterium]
MYRYFDVDRYRGAEKNRQRKMGLRIGLLVVLVVVLSIAAAAGIYVSNINARLSANVTDDLRDQLVQSTPGNPFYLLLLGVDKDQGRIEDTENYGTDEHAYRSDSIMLCRIDPKKVKVTMVSIHRDTLIDMGNHGEQKINAAYAFGGAAYATKVVSEFAGVPISHYAEVDLDRFITIVDQVGGVTVNLPVPVYDPEYTGLDLPAGEQTLDGREAALLCRCRHGYDEYGDGDRFRAANQRMVFSEVIKKVLRSDPATIASTVSTMADSVTTDMSVETILDLALQMQSLDVETDIATGMEPTDGALIDGTWYEICMVDEWQKMMTRVDKGLPPYDEEDGEYDSTAGIAGGVGESGKKAAKAAAEADSQDSSDDDSDSDEEYYTDNDVADWG